MTGAVLAIVGVLAATALGAWFYYFVWPGLMKFRKLRDNVNEEMVRCKDVLTTKYGGTGFQLPEYPTPAVREEAKASYHDLASQLGAFQQNEPIAAWVISRWCELNTASEGLRKLSQSVDDPKYVSPESGTQRAAHEGVVRRALRV